MNLLFVDSDILLDALLKREPFYKWAAMVLALNDSKKYVCCTSVHTLLNVHYLAKKVVGEKAAREAIKILIDKIKVITEDSTLINKAAYSSFSDFEDAVQYYAAISANCNAIITRNIKDYKNSTIPVLTAEQFLRTL